MKYLIVFFCLLCYNVFAEEKTSGTLSVTATVVRTVTLKTENLMNKKILKDKNIIAEIKIDKKKQIIEVYF